MIERPTTCGFCSCGCALYVEPKDGRVGAICPSANHPVSTGRLCIKGWNATPSVLGTNRLRTPLVRKGDSLEPASWEEAISLTASALKQAGPDKTGAIGSSKTTNEECYALVKLARSIIGTPNIDGACRFYDASLIRALLDTTGTPASQTDISSIADAGAILIVGANAREMSPHVASRVEDAVVENGCSVVAADPRFFALAPGAEVSLHPRPGTDLIWLRALIREIIDHKLYTDDAPAIPGFEELRVSVADATVDGLGALCGMEGAAVAEAAQTLARSKPLVVMFGLGVLQQPNSTEIVKALASVANLLGGAVVPLRGQNNAQGAADLGLANDFLPGYAPLEDSEARSVWESAWSCRLPSGPGMSAVEMIRACGSGELAALMVFGDNVALSAPSTEETVKALGKAGFLAVADLYLTETAELANVVFPASSFLEKDGTFTSIERRVQRVRKVFEPVGESRSDLEIIADLAAALGKDLARDPQAVMAEISAHVPQYEGVSYEALDKSWGRQWPLNGAAAKLTPVPVVAADRDEEYPFRLVAGRINFHQQTGTMAVRSGVLAREYPGAYAEMNEADAGKLGLRPGRPIRISSKTGALTRNLIFSDALPAGCVHVPHFFGGDSPNALASYDCDPVSGVPAYKAIPVKIEAVK